MHDLLIAAADHAAPDHGVVLVALVVMAAAGGLIYGLRRAMVKSRAARTRSDEGRSGRDPAA